MHEMSIAQNIVDIAASELKKANAHQIISLEIEIGALSGVEYDALKFALTAIKPNGVLKDTDITIKIINGKGSCNDCKHTFKIAQLFDSCPKCNSYFINILQGKEMKIKSMVVD